MPKPTADDFETDFEGALGALADEVLKEILAVPDDKRSDYFTMQSAGRLAKFISIQAPSFLIEREERMLAKRLRDRAKDRRQQDRQTPA